jgi:hypothetical protein
MYEGFLWVDYILLIFLNHMCIVFFYLMVSYIDIAPALFSLQCLLQFCKMVQYFFPICKSQGAYISCEYKMELPIAEN